MIFAAGGQSIGTNAAASVTAPTMNTTRSQIADDRLAPDNSTVLMGTQSIRARPDQCSHRAERQRLSAALMTGVASGHEMGRVD